jgi:hypothetical protein
LDFSANNLKEEPTELLKYLSEPNQLVELNLSNTEIDLEKLFTSLSKGGCDFYLKKLVLNHNHGLNKSTISLSKFLLNAKSLTHFEISNCKLNGSIIQIILTSLKLNQNIANNNEFHLNLSSNDLGSNLRLFMSDLNASCGITSLDLSENNLDVDADSLVAQMQLSKIRSLTLSRNFFNAKAKHCVRIVQALTKWLMTKQSSLQQLWLCDCKLKSNLNDLIGEMGAFSNLLHFDISGNDIGDFGVNLLSKSLQVNRSLSYLAFDRSNATSIQSYQHILDSLQRNNTLKAIEMPIADICLLHQRAPEKVVDIFRQMCEVFQQRNLLNSKGHCDLNQLFKTKIRLINESTTTETSSASKVFIDDSLSDFIVNETATKANDSFFIKEILQNLNESAHDYLADKPIVKQVERVTENLFERVDSHLVGLEASLVDRLCQKYSKHQSAIESFSSSKKPTSSLGIPSYIAEEVAKLKANLKEYMNAMSTQIHNDICEISFKLSTNLAEKLINETKKYPTLNDAVLSQKTELVNATEKSTSVKKGLINGIKLPMFSSNFEKKKRENETENDNDYDDDNDEDEANQKSTAATAVHYRSSNNSKTKRPISNQIYGDTTPSIPETNNDNNIKTFSSNENIAEISDDDDETSTTKTSFNTAQKVISTSLKINAPNNLPEAGPTIDAAQLQLPIPAPRTKIKTFSGVKNFLSGLTGAKEPTISLKVTPSIISSPLTPRKLETPMAAHEPSVQTVESSVSDATNSTASALTAPSLTHLNRDRPRRSNVTKPKSKMPQNKIEIDTPNDDLKVFESSSETNATTGVLTTEQTEQSVELLATSPFNNQTPDLDAVQQLPKINNNQPKISLNVLETVKLRKTAVRPQNTTIIEDSVTDNASNNSSPAALTVTGAGIGSSSLSSSTHKLGNRFSMFEQSTAATTTTGGSYCKFSLKKTDLSSSNSSDTTESISEETQRKVVSPKPVLPMKPLARPSFNPIAVKSKFSPEPILECQSDGHQPNKFFKLKPINVANVRVEQAAANNDPAESKTSTSSEDFSKELSSPLLLSSSSAEVLNIKGIPEASHNPDKRSSVKDIIQMLSDESKA